MDLVKRVFASFRTIAAEDITRAVTPAPTPADAVTTPDVPALARVETAAECSKESTVKEFIMFDGILYEADRPIFATVGDYCRHLIDGDDTTVSLTNDHLIDNCCESLWAGSTVTDAYIRELPYAQHFTLATDTEDELVVAPAVDSAGDTGNKEVAEMAINTTPFGNGQDEPSIVTCVEVRDAWIACQVQHALSGQPFDYDTCAEEEARMYAVCDQADHEYHECRYWAQKEGRDPNACVDPRAQAVEVTGERDYVVATPYTFDEDGCFRINGIDLQQGPEPDNDGAIEEVEDDVVDMEPDLFRIDMAIASGLADRIEALFPVDLQPGSRALVIGEKGRSMFLECLERAQNGHEDWLAYVVREVKAGRSDSNSEIADFMMLVGLGTMYGAIVEIGETGEDNTIGAALRAHRNANSTFSLTDRWFTANGESKSYQLELPHCRFTLVTTENRNGSYQLEVSYKRHRSTHSVTIHTSGGGYKAAHDAEVAKWLAKSGDDLLDYVGTL